MKLQRLRKNFTKASKWLRYSEIKYLWSEISDSCAISYCVYNQPISRFWHFRAQLSTAEMPISAPSKQPFHPLKA